MKDTVTSDVVLERLLALHPKKIDLVLDRVWRLLSAVGNPELSLPPVVHIAGTNGKGSTQAMIRAGLEAAGNRVHAYTSPHLVRFHERIRLSGTLIDEDELSALLEDCETANGGEPITFFEITTVAALLAFARHEADYTLLEVGLGGRLDATNVVEKPELCVITPVSLDHQQFLGETIEQIAAEKAGILKPGVPCIVAAQTDAARDVIEARAAEVGAPLSISGQDWTVHTEHGRLVYQDERGLLDLDPPVLPGAHQIQNAGTAIAALRALGLADQPAQAALSNADWPARMQRLRTGPLVDLLPDSFELWLDGGHNSAAGEAIAAVLDDWHASRPRPVHLVCGMLDTKSAEDFLGPLTPRTTSVQTVGIPNAEASFSAEDLAGLAGSGATPAGSVEDALEDIATRHDDPCRILICGSLYLAGHVLALNS
ncbi:MAG: folylpolyglutamate synthase/dihydrofolate synthase family protein [Pseudomonadota bacterium]